MSCLSGFPLYCLYLFLIISCSLFVPVTFISLTVLARAMLHLYVYLISNQSAVDTSKLNVILSILIMCKGLEAMYNLD